MKSVCSERNSFWGCLVDWVIGYGKDSMTKTHDAVSTKESSNSEDGCLINLCYFRNTPPSNISNLVRYWAVNNILYGVNLIHSGTKLQWITTPYHIWSKWKISTYNKKQNIIQVRNKIKTLLMTRGSVICWSWVDNEILENGHSNTISMEFYVVSMTLSSTRAELIQENMDMLNAGPITRDYIIHLL